MRRRVGAGRDRQPCPRCGRDVIVRRDGGLMAHNGTDGRSCVAARWKAGELVEPVELVAAQLDRPADDDTAGRS